MERMEGVVGRRDMVVDAVSRCRHLVGWDRTEDSRSRTVGGTGS